MSQLTHLYNLDLYVFFNYYLLNSLLACINKVALVILYNSIQRLLMNENHAHFCQKSANTAGVHYIESSSVSSNYITKYWDQLLGHRQEDFQKRSRFNICCRRSIAALQLKSRKEGTCRPTSIIIYIYIYSKQHFICNKCLKQYIAYIVIQLVIESRKNILYAQST